MPLPPPSAPPPTSTTIPSVPTTDPEEAASAAIRLSQNTVPDDRDIVDLKILNGAWERHPVEGKTDGDHDVPLRPIRQLYGKKSGDYLRLMDELLKEYQEKGHKNQKEYLKRFYNYWSRMTAEQPSDFIAMPAKVRGVLDSTRFLHPEFQDQMFLVKLGGGVLKEINVGSRIVANMILEVEFKRILRWIWANPKSIRVWLFISGFLLLVGAFLQIWIDFSKGRIWRAFLMELVCVLACVIMGLEANTPFLQACVRGPIQKQFNCLRRVFPRVYFYASMVFFCSQYWTLHDIPILVGNLLLIIWTFILFFARRDLYKHSKVARQTAKDGNNLQTLFAQHDKDRDSLLKLNELSSLLAEIYPKNLWMWQEELMLLEYDSRFLGGLRLEDLVDWFEQEE